MDVSTPVYNSWLSEAVFKAAFFIGVDNVRLLSAAAELAVQKLIYVLRQTIY
jgi:hypothetical protein